VTSVKKLSGAVHICHLC